MEEVKRKERERIERGEKPENMPTLPNLAVDLTTAYEPSEVGSQYGGSYYPRRPNYYPYPRKASDFSDVASVTSDYSHYSHHSAGNSSHARHNSSGRYGTNSYYSANASNFPGPYNGPSQFSQHTGHRPMVSDARPGTPTNMPGQRHLHPGARSNVSGNSAARSNVSGGKVLNTQARYPPRNQ